MKRSCLICDRINKIKNGLNPFFIHELSTGYVVFCDFQYYKGYTIFLSKIHTDELHKLKERETFLKEMAIVAEAVYKTFKPKKLNYELLGNTDKHLHWHIIPRYNNDPNPKTPIWLNDKSIRCNTNTIPTKEELNLMKKKFIFNLKKLL